MNPTIARLHRLLAYFENGAASIRSTLALLDHDPTARGNGHAATNGHAVPAMMRDALALDATRRGNGKIRKPAAAGPKVSGADRIKRRAVTARTLALFDPDTPVMLGDLPLKARKAGIATIERWGYIRRKGGGFVRTAKPFTVDDRPGAK